MKSIKKILPVFTAVMMLAGICFMTSGCGAKKYSCGVQSGTTAWSFMQGDEEWGFKGFSNIEVKPYDNIGLALADTLNENCDFVVVDDAPGKSLVASNKGSKLIDIALTTEAYGIGVAKGDDKLLGQINEILEKKDDDVKAIIDKYAAVTDENANEYNGETVASAVQDDSKEQFVVATNAAFAPYEFKIGENFAGVDMELAKLIADELGQELVIIDMEFDAVVSSVGKAGVDAAISGMTINASRKKSVNFSEPYYEGAYQVIVCAEDCTLFDDCKTSEELIAVLNGLHK